MGRRYIAILFALLFPLACSSCSFYQEVEQTYLLASVIYQHPNSTEKIIYHYNNAGQVVGESLYHDDLLQSETFIEYDPFGNELSSRTSLGDEVVECIEYVNTYDSFENLIKIETFKNDESVRIQKFDYSEQGELLSLVDERNLGDSTSISTQMYSSEGHLLCEKIVTSSEYGSVESNTVFTYDKNGNLIETRNTFAGGSRIVKTSYNSCGQKIHETTYDGENQGVYYYSEHTYSEFAHTEKQYLEDGTLVATVIRTYDQAGNLVQVDTYNESGDLKHSYLYSYIKLIK